MCGIIGSFGGDVVADTLRQYEKQKGRGQEGFGFVALRGGRMVAFERSTNDKSIRALMMSIEDLKPDTILFHHRFPTSTGNYVEAAHPLPITKKKGWKHRYYMLHNGVVSGENTSEIRKDGYECKSRIEEIKYTRTYSGKVYSTVVDSEVNDSEYLGYYVASLLEGKRKDIPMSGPIACFMLQEHKTTGECKVFAMRNYMNPLEIVRSKGKGGHTLQMSSEGKGGATLESHAIFEVDMRTLKLSEHMRVNIGKVYEMSYAQPYTSPKNYQSPTSQYSVKNGVLHVGDKPSTLGKDAETIKDMIGFDTRVKSSEDAIAESEANRLQLKCDAAYDAWQEAKAEFTNEDDPEVKKYLQELYEEYCELEIQLQALGFVDAQSKVLDALGG